jgi:hypothetical protein
MASRPAIPADIERRVLIEAGHRCAIPTCRHIDVDIHHIIPWEKCQAHEYDNLIALCPNCHRRSDKGEIDRKSLRLYKARLRFAHDKFSNLEIDVLFETARHANGMFWPAFNAMLIKRILDAGYVQLFEHPHIRTASGGMNTSPQILRVTDAGVRFLNSLEPPAGD